MAYDAESDEAVTAATQRTLEQVERWPGVPTYIYRPALTDHPREFAAILAVLREHDQPVRFFGPRRRRRKVRGTI